MAAGVSLTEDATILLTHGAGRPAVEAALRRVLGRSVSSDGVSFSGKTDRQILREIMVVAGVPAAEVDGVLEQLVQAYLEEMPRRLDVARIEVMPGVHELIERLGQMENVQLGLLTGNLESTAYLKLKAVALDGHFPFGAFGSDFEDRNSLPKVALERAEAHLGKSITPANTVIIGDTVHDITCGKLSGCRTLAVSTGRYSNEELAPLEPDLLLDDLGDVERIVRFLTPT